MINYSYFRPRIMPVLGSVHSAEIDRAQSITAPVTLNRTRVDELGRDGAVGYISTSPSVSYTLSQLEYGNIELYEKLTCSTAKGGVGEDAITQADFKTPYFDLCAYMVDDDSTFRGTVYYPALRTNSFGLSIPGPQEIMERSFDFVGESAIIYQGDNKYLIYDYHTAGSGDDNEIDLSSTPPVLDPDDSTTYIIRVVRVRSGTSTVLTLTTDYTYSNSTKILTIVSAQTGDVYKYWYTSGTAPAVQFTENDTDAAGLLGDCASIYLYVPASGKPSSSDYIYRLQSVNLDIAFEREDLREIGNKSVVLRGVKNTTVTATLGRKAEQWTLEEAMRGAVADYGKIDVEQFSNSISLIVKIFTDNTKGTLAYGFLCTGMTPTDTNLNPSVQNYTNAEATLEGTSFSISADATILGI